MHIFRWDIDKTYLETSFSSFRGLLKTAIETADQKKNVAGSAALLRSLISSNPGCKVTVISGSPTQLRPVLEEKFAIDGVDIDELVLKDNLKNIRRGKFKAVTNQIGYKLPALFQQRRGLGPAVKETLFGDDTEADALIYALYAAGLEEQVDEDTISRVMSAMGTPRDTIQRTLNALRDTTHGAVVDHIFIRVHRGLPIKCYGALGPRVIPVFSWYQAAVILHIAGKLSLLGLEQTAESCVLSGQLSHQQLSWLTQDLVRRGLLDIEHYVRTLKTSDSLAPLIPHLIQTSQDLGGMSQRTVEPQIDYLSFVRDIHEWKPTKH